MNNTIFHSCFYKSLLSPRNADECDLIDFSIPTTYDPEMTFTKPGKKDVQKNVGGLDRFFRLAVGFLSLAIAYASQDTLLQLIFGLVALLGLGTAITGYCPINARLGMDTTRKKG